MTCRNQCVDSHLANFTKCEVLLLRRNVQWNRKHGKSKIVLTVCRWSDCFNIVNQCVSSEGATLSACNIESDMRMSWSSDVSFLYALDATILHAKCMTLKLQKVLRMNVASLFPVVSRLVLPKSSKMKEEIQKYIHFMLAIWGQESPISVIFVIFNTIPFWIREMVPAYILW